MSEQIDEATIKAYITSALGGVDVVEANGDSFFFYDPGRDILPDRRFPFATLVTSNFNDTHSDLDRSGVFRLNVGVSRETFESLFGTEPPPTDGEADADPRYNFAALDTLLPHPVYGRMHWVCILNPSPETFATVQTLLAEAYNRAADRDARRSPTS